MAPLANLTDAGTVAADGFELLNVTVSPVEGAGPLKVTVPVTAVAEPPTTETGETETL